MDNASRWYAFRFEQAKKLWKEGKKDECLDICWEMRLEPALSLYRRAHVNLLIAKVVDLKEHPDAAMYAQECVDLVDIILERGASNHPEYLRRVTAEAKEEKERIERDVAKLAEEKDEKPEEEEKKRWGEPLDLSKLEAQIQEGTLEEFGQTASSLMTLEQREPLQIEGMYKEEASFGASVASVGTEKMVEKQLGGLSLEKQEFILPMPPPSQALNDRDKEDIEMK